MYDDYEKTHRISVDDPRVKAIFAASGFDPDAETEIVSGEDPRFQEIIAAYERNVHNEPTKTKDVGWEIDDDQYAPTVVGAPNLWPQFEPVPETETKEMLERPIADPDTEERPSSFAGPRACSATAVSPQFVMFEDTDPTKPTSFPTPALPVEPNQTNFADELRRNTMLALSLFLIALTIVSVTAVGIIF